MLVPPPRYQPRQESGSRSYKDDRGDLGPQIWGIFIVCGAPLTDWFTCTTINLECVGYTLIVERGGCIGGSSSSLVTWPTIAH